MVSTTLEGPLDWPNATVVSGDAVDVVARLKEESDVPLRSHGSLSMNRALMAAGLVDRVQVTLFPVVRRGQARGLRGTELSPWAAGLADLALVETGRSPASSQEHRSTPTSPSTWSRAGPSTGGSSCWNSAHRA